MIIQKRSKSRIVYRNIISGRFDFENCSDGLILEMQEQESRYIKKILDNFKKDSDGEPIFIDYYYPLNFENAYEIYKLFRQGKIDWYATRINYNQKSTFDEPENSVLPWLHKDFDLIIKKYEEEHPSN